MSLIRRTSGRRARGIDRRVEVTRTIHAFLKANEPQIRAMESRARTHGVPYAANCGWCVELADELERRFPDGEQLATDHAAINPTYFPYSLSQAEVDLMDDGAHVWFYLQRLHFDAEAPHGVADWRELPLFRRQQ
ncbi:MAG TPA: hypothetical protein EYF98_14085 [Planctomycetes bacterium]|nr:hypothetical protein [Planctomycetota bacterium]